MSTAELGPLADPAVQKRPPPGMRSPDIFSLGQTSGRPPESAERHFEDIQHSECKKTSAGSRRRLIKWASVPIRGPKIVLCNLIALSHSVITLQRVIRRSESSFAATFSQIRILDHCVDDIPACKLAINDSQRRLIQDEFSILQRLSVNKAPVIRTCNELLRDEQGILGFRMERLFD
jgi:hypothetical protein